ncbi:hypothetical protein QJQ45_017218 [Haematococcus lacustris]|nr:hypothetical protein QJQ45_017218 [Haematococcus lacustris]
MLLPPGSSHPALLEAAGLASKLLASFHPPPPSRPPPFTPFSSFLTLSQQPLTPVTLNAQDLVKLAGCVRREEGEGGGGAASLAPVIQHPALMQLLIAGTFVPGKVTNTDSRDAAIDILVAASTCPSSASCVHIPDDARLLLCEGLGLSRDECLVQQDAWCDQSAERVQAAEETRAALYSVLAVGAKAGARLTPEDAGAVQQIVRIPVAAAALLHYARFHLTNTDYYAEAAAASSGAPAYIRLALLVARVQPALAPQVVWLLACALEAQGSGRAELTGLTTGVLAHLMREGLCVGSVQEALGAWAQAADPSLVRHMIMQVLGCVSPPYSQLFARWLLDLMVRSNMKPRSAREGSVMGSAAAAAAAALTARGGGAAQGGDAGAGPVMSGAALLQEFAEVVLAMAGGGSAGTNASRDARRMLQGGADALRRGAAGRGDLDASKQGARGKASAVMALTAKEVTLLQELAHGSAR